MAARRQVMHNMAIVVGVLFVAGLLTCLAPLLRQEDPILPSESQEIASKRFASENAYFPLAEAVAALPQKPSRFAPAYKDYRPVPGSLGEIVNMWRPDDSPELIAYLDACVPAIDKMREALRRPYFLLPIDWKKFPNPLSNESNPIVTARQISVSGVLLAANGLRALRKGDEAGALARIIDTYRFSILVMEDGGTATRHAAVILRNTLPCLNEFARTFSEEALRQALTSLRALVSQLKPQITNGEFLLRTIDTGMAYLNPPPNSVRSPIRILTDAKARWDLHSQAKRHKDELLALLDRPYGENCGNLERLGGAFEHLLSDMQDLVASRAWLITALNGASLVFAIELYKREQGALPETLEALTPKYLDSIPFDPLSSSPLVYKRIGEDYSFYSVGMNGIDNEGRDHRKEGRLAGDDVVIHAPRVS